MLLDGLHIPLTTPFYPDGRVYLRKLEANAARCSLTLASGFVVLSAVGEAGLLSEAERKQVLETVAAAAAPEKILLASVALPGVAATLEEIGFAHGLQYDAAVLEVPSAYPEQMWKAGAPTAELVTYFQTVADRSPLPIVLCSGSHAMVLPVSLIAELSGHPNVLGLLEQTGDPGRVSAVLEATAGVRRTLTVTPTFTAATGRMLHPPGADTASSGSFVSAASLAAGSALATAPPAAAIRTRTKEAGLQILWSGCEGALTALRAGASGFAPALAAAVPQACFELWAAWKDGNTALMAEKERRVVGAERAVTAFGVAGIKAASEQSGYFGGRPRLPLLPLTAEAADSMLPALHGMRS